MAKRKCTHSFVTTTWSETINGEAFAIAVHCAVPGCNARLSLGPSNDSADVPVDEIIAAVCAHSDADHEAFEATEGWTWDPSRPIAGQFELTGPTDQGQQRAETREEYNQRTGTTRHTVPGEPFAPEDSANAEPWADPGASTRLTDAELVETVAYAPPGSVRE